jgi:hypothetical protein
MPATVRNNRTLEVVVHKRKYVSLSHFQSFRMIYKEKRLLTIYDEKRCLVQEIEWG